jgi:hypothetical protein
MMSMVVPENVQGEVGDPLDPNVISWPSMTSQVNKYIKIALGALFSFLIAGMLVYGFKDSITAWADPNTFAKQSERMRRRKKDQIIGLVVFIFDLVRGIIACIQDYAPKEWLCVKDPVSGQLTSTENQFAYWLERIDRAIDKIMMVAKIFIVAQYDSWARNGLDSWANEVNQLANSAQPRITKGNR